MIRSWKKLIHRLLGEDIKLALREGPSLVCVMADESQLQHVLFNMATNARDAMPKGGKLTISTGVGPIKKGGSSNPDQNQELALIWVSDTGMGMDETVQKNIFDPFFTTKVNGKGSGLGLSTSYGIIQQHKGNIQVESLPEKGTKFTISLPVSAPAENIQPLFSPVANATKTIEIKCPPKTSKAHGKTILYAEDDEKVRKPLLALLRDIGYHVIQAKNGAEAITRFIENMDIIDLLLLDLVMPVMGGKEAYEIIKKINPNVPTIFMTGYSKGFRPVNEYFGRDDDFLTKPIDLNELLKHIEKTLKNKPKGPK